MIKKIFKYFEPLWSGNDGKISLRASLAILFAIDFVRNLSYAIYKWDAGRSLEGLSLSLGIEAGLIVGLLGLTTYQNMQAFGKGDTFHQTTTQVTEVKKKEEGKTDSVEQLPE
jgi:hypothetical protein